MPKIQGDATKLHPAVVIFALILGGAIAGLLGAILALPIAATMRDIYVYAFRRAEGIEPADAAIGHARPAPDTGPRGLEAEPAPAPDVAATGRRPAGARERARPAAAASEPTEGEARRPARG